MGIRKDGPIRRWLRKQRDEDKKRLCLDVVDALDEAKHILFDAYTVYDEGFRDLAIGRKRAAYFRTERAIRLLRGAAEKAEKIRRRAITKGAPEVVTKNDIEYIRTNFKKLADLMEEDLKPPEELVYLKPPGKLEDVVYEIDGELYKRMFQKFHACMQIVSK